jgi:hypothetical protein
MRSTKRVDLDSVVAKFEQWRKDRRSRAIPDELWDSAIGLLALHSATDICRALGLNHSRFNQARGERGAAPPASRKARRGRVTARRPGSGTSRNASGFVELMPVRLGPGRAVPPGGGGTVGMGMPTPAPAGWRLTVESAAGTLSLVTRGSSSAPGGDLVETLCRLVIASVVAGSQS